MKIKNRIIVTITIPLFLFTLVFGFFVIKKEMNIENGKLNDKINHYNILLQTINTGLLWDFDSEKIKNNLNIIFSDPEVYRIRMKDITGVINFNLEKNGKVNTSRLKKYDLGILKDEITLGEVSIDYSMELYYSKLFNLIFERIFLTLGLIGISILAVYLISGRLLRPIDSVVDALKEIDSGNTGARLSINTGDEFSEIEKFFNKMAVTIEREIQARNEREQQLRDMHQYLNSIFDSIPSILISLDRFGTIRKLNSTALNFADRAAGEIIDKPVWDIFPQLNEYRNDIEAVLESDSSMNIKRHYASADGELHIDISISSLYHGGITGAVIRMEDVTVMKKKDEKLSQAQMMDSIGNLAGGIAHDFNNALAGITGTVSLLKYRLDRHELAEDDLEKFLNLMDDSGKRAAELTKQILSLSRRSEITMSHNDMNEIIRRVVNFCFHSFDKSIEIQPFYFPEPAIAETDSTRIEQVLLNLCINASHAMTIMRPDNDKNGGILRIEIEKIAADKVSGTIIPIVDFSTGYWKISVIDNGIGMDRKTQERIFEPFFTTKSKTSGTGLGLAMSYNIVRQHKGFIDVTSEPGKGSTFSIYIPATENREVSDIMEHTDVPCGSGTVMIIDDESSICETTEDMLKYCGYDIIIESDPLNAVDTFLKKSDIIDCVILDLNMPKKSGYEILKEIKKYSAEVKVLIISGSVSDEKMKILSEDGADDFIIKPYTLETLANSLYRLLS